MKRSPSFQWISKAFNDVMELVAESTPNMPVQEEEESSQSCFFYESEFGGEKNADDEREREKLNESNESAQSKLDSTRKNFSLFSFAEIAAPMKVEISNSPFIKDGNKRNVFMCEKRKSNFNTHFVNMGEIYGSIKMKENFSLKSLVSASKKVLSLSQFQNPSEKELCNENMEEMHEIFRDGNFVMIDGLIMLAPEESRGQIFSRTAQ